MREAPSRVPWLTASFVTAAAAASAWPSAAAALRYHREAAAAGELWRAFSAQLVHGSVSLAAVDLGVVLLCGAWLEGRSRGLAAAALGLGLLAVAVTVHAAQPQVWSFEGSSGVAAALFAALALHVALHANNGGARALAWLVLVVALAKAAVEQATGWSVSGDALLEGSRVLPAAHLAGSLAGLCASGFATILQGRRADTVPRSQRSLFQADEVLQGSP
jgi:rhomboid family GlyGly-CTERM serine protease